MKCLILRGFLLINERARTRKNRAGEAHGAQGRNRTTDTAIFSRMLYQLSYLGRSQGPKKPVEPAGYSGREQSCLPRGRGLSGGFSHCAKSAGSALTAS